MLLLLVLSRSYVSDDHCQKGGHVRHVSSRVGMREATVNTCEEQHPRIDIVGYKGFVFLLL